MIPRDFPRPRVMVVGSGLSTIQPMTPQPEPQPEHPRPRHFMTIRRSRWEGIEIVDAVATDGTAWWMAPQVDGDWYPHTELPSA